MNEGDVIFYIMTKVNIIFDIMSSVNVIMLLGFRLLLAYNFIMNGILYSCLNMDYASYWFVILLYVCY